MEFEVAVIFGVVTGVLYGLAALGLVLVYRVSRVLNFALAGTAAVTSYEASTLTAAHWPYAAILILVLASGAALGAACHWILSFASGAGTLVIGVGTIGLFLAIQGIVSLFWGPDARVLPLPINGTWKLGRIELSRFEVLAVVIALIAVFLVFILVYRTRLGLSMRAVSAGPRTAELLGINRRTTERWAWALGGVVGSLAGLLIVPLFELTQNVMVTFLLASFSAVVIGGFTSLGGVVLAGITVSVVLNILSILVSSTSPNLFTLILIVLVLFFRPHGLFGLSEHEVAEPSLPARSQRTSRIQKWCSPRSVRARRIPSLSSTFKVMGQSLSLGIIVLAALVSAALIYGLVAGGTTSFMFATALAMFVAVLGLSSITGLSGQVSLGQGAFVGLGAYTSGVVAVHFHVSVWFALPLAVVVGGVVGIIVGWPAARFSGVYLIVFTLAFGLVIPEFLLNQSFFGGANGLFVSTPTFMENSRYEYLVAAVVAAIAAACFAVVRRTQFGRRWRAVRDSEAAVAAIGWSPTFNKVSAFAFGSAFAAVGGAMTGILVGYVSSDGYGVFASVNLIVAVIVGGTGTITGSLVGALVVTLLPFYVSTSSASEFIFGAAVVIVVVATPEGLANRLMKRRASWANFSGGPSEVATNEFNGNARSASMPKTSVEFRVQPAAKRGPAEELPLIPDPVLDIQGLTVAYAGGPALLNMNLQIGRGDAVAVVGANGAGKSTLLRAISGWVRPLDGHVLFNLVDITGEPAFKVARLGIAHVPEGRCVFPDITVADNLRLGYRREGSRSEADLLDQVLEIFPKLKQRLGQHAGNMSGGEQQMLVVGRGLMADPQVLMLDEPSLGLAPVIINEMFQALTTIIGTGVSVLLVEQNVRSALQFAKRAYVLSRGECVMSGDAQRLAADEDLIGAFLV